MTIVTASGAKEISFWDLPIMYEDDGEPDMGEANQHVDADEILHICLKAHFARTESKYRCFSNMNLYYDPKHPQSYVSPDDMVVAPFRDLGEYVTSYRIGVDGPSPVLTAEVLSETTSKEGDLDAKVVIYAALGVAEYILVDVSGDYLPQRLLMKRLQSDATYRDEQDADGGITSVLGFRLIIDADDRLRVINTVTGRPYPRPDEADEEAEGREREAEARRLAEEARKREEEARKREEEARMREEEARMREEAARLQAEERVRELEEELARLRARQAEQSN